MDALGEERVRTVMLPYHYTSEDSLKDAADCAKAVTQTDLNVCAGEAFKAADAGLNAAYGDLLKEPALASRLDGLRASERAWVAYRDAECAFEGSAYDGGSMQPMVAANCAETLTKRRTADLKAALACARGPEGC